MINIEIIGKAGNYTVALSMHKFLDKNVVVIKYNEELITSQEYTRDESYNFVMAVFQKLFFEMV